MTCCCEFKHIIYLIKISDIYLTYRSWKLISEIGYAVASALLNP